MSSTFIFNPTSLYFSSYIMAMKQCSPMDPFTQMCMLANQQELINNRMSS